VDAVVPRRRQVVRGYCSGVDEEEERHCGEGEVEQARRGERGVCSSLYAQKEEQDESVVSLVRSNTIAEAFSSRTATEEASERAASSEPARPKAEPIEVGVQGDTMAGPSYTGYGLQGAILCASPPRRLSLTLFASYSRPTTSHAGALGHRRGCSPHVRRSSSWGRGLGGDLSGDAAEYSHGRGVEGEVVHRCQKRQSW